MADIAAGDVTCVVLSRRRVGQSKGGATMVDVAVDITIDPGTDDAYPTGGIPLTTLFTTSNGEFVDTGLDTAVPIVEMGGGIARISDALAPSTPGMFYNGGITAASQTLVLYVIPSNAGTANETMVEYPNADITADSGSFLALAVGDKDIKYRTVLRGVLRPAAAGYTVV